MFDERRIDSIFAGLDGGHAPGAAVGISIGGRPVYRRGFGVASVELPVKLSPCIRMPIGSATKHFTCLAYLLLCEEGRASIEDTISKYLPELHPVSHAVTVRQLMGHVGGLRDAYEIAMAFGGIKRELSAAQVLSSYRDISDVNAAPGEAWIYNNGGYLILSAIIERIAGRSLEEVLRRRVFEPVGMHDTQLRRFDSVCLPNSATLHLPTASGMFERGYRSIEGVGQGGIVSTINDMLQWLAHMSAPTVGTGATWSLLKTPQRLLNGASTGYGMGLGVGRYRDIDILSHAGGVIGGNSQLLKAPAAGVDIVVMANRSDVSSMQLAYEILDVCLGASGAEQDEAKQILISGVFRSPATGRVVHLFAQSDRQMASIEGIDMPVSFRPGAVLVPLPAGAVARQSIRLVGGITHPRSVELRSFGSVDELVPVPPAVESGAHVIAGSYRSSSIGVDATISADGLLVTTGPFGSTSYVLRPLARNLWRANATRPMGLSGLLCFERQGEAFCFSNQRTWNLVFRRLD